MTSWKLWITSWKLWLTQEQTQVVGPRCEELCHLALRNPSVDREGFLGRKTPPQYLFVERKKIEEATGASVSLAWLF